ncbi:MAG: hypothetical protein EXR37_04260 [Limnohabitans sp.]|nr:hypothetical protein [Limnohabitans sp.]
MKLLSETGLRRMALSLTLVVACLPMAHALEEEPACPSYFDESQCKFENESLSLFIKGRDAYDHGREIGDLTQAREIGYQLAARKNKNGRALLKMIYMEIRMGGHKNYVQAYDWVQEAMQRNESYARLDFKTVLDAMKKRMTPEQLAEVQAKYP